MTRFRRTRRRLRRLRHDFHGRLLFAVVVSVHGVIHHLPRRLNHLLGLAGGQIAMLLLPQHARRAGRQLQRLPMESRPSVGQVFGHLGVCTADACSFRPASADRWIDVEGMDLLNQRIDAPEGTVWVSGHVGHWEMPAAWAASRGIPVHAVVAPIHYRALDRWVRRLRQRHGVCPLDPGTRGLRQAVRVLRDGGHVAALIDQQVPGRGTWVPFLGSPAWTPTGAARLARLAGVPIGVVSCVRQPGGRYRIRFGPLLRSDRDGATVTGEVTRAIESIVREHPEQWVWMHDRWKAPA